MDVEDDHPSPLESREPSVEDLVGLCRELNARGARYVIVGGFAVRAAGLDRRTIDIDVLLEMTPENERRVLDAVATLPDGAARAIEAGEIEKYVVVRVADEIVVDLMKSASGFDYARAAEGIATREIDGVAIPFASPDERRRAVAPRSANVEAAVEEQCAGPSGSHGIRVGRT